MKTIPQPIHPDAFEGQWAITPDVLWTLVWDEENPLDPKKPRILNQWICLADPDEEGMRVLEKATMGTGRFLFALSLAQMRRAIDGLSLSDQNMIKTGSSDFPLWMPVLQKKYAVLFQKNGGVHISIRKSHSAQNAIEQVQRDEPHAMIISCGSKEDIGGASRAMEEIIEKKDTTSILGDFRALHDRDAMWLDMARNPNFRRQAA